MGTFHADKGDLHGITVVVRTVDPRVVYVGRCDTEGPEGILLLDSDRHEDGEGGRTTEGYLERAARFGVFSKDPRLLVPRAEIASVQRLGELHK